MRRLIFVMVLMAFPALAQEEFEAFQEFRRIGEISAVIDGAAVTLPVSTIREGREGFASVKMELGSPVINITGVTVDSVGRIGYPWLELRLPLVEGQPGPFALISYIESEHEPTPTMAGAPAGKLDISDFFYTETGEVFFTFEAELIQLDSDWQPLAGQPPMEISGAVMVTIPDRFRDE